MRTPTHRRMLLASLLLSAILLGGCGSAQTKTVSVSSSPQSSTTGDSESSVTAATQTKSTPTTTSKGTSTSEQASKEATRTSTAPAFTKETETADEEGLNAAAAVVRSHGYTASDTSDYHPHQTLRVLVGTRTGSGDGYGQQAFFFVDGRYIGTDSSEPSATIKVVSQSDTEVTLAYPLYKAHDPLCCPGGGQATVHFQLNNGRLVPLDPIPPANSQTGLSRQ